MASFESIRAQLQPIPYPTSTFTGQTVIITGSNSGLGLEAARHFLRLGVSKLILAVRSIQKGEAAKASLEASSDRNNVIEVWLLDMLNYESILAFVSRCNTLDRLDVVVANAGVLKNTYEESGGTEITIKVNVIATFLLAIALFPALRKSTALTGHTGRIVVTSSVMHEQVGSSNSFHSCCPTTATSYELNEPRPNFQSAMSLQYSSLSTKTKSLISRTGTTLPSFLNYS